MKNKLSKIFSFVMIFLKLMCAWFVLHISQRKLLKQNIWLIREKRDEARDNGFHFFKYLKENHKDINCFYAITNKSADRQKVEKYGNLIEADSFKHCIYFLASAFSINSQPFGAYPFHMGLRELKLIQKLCNKKQKVVFLQHGIIKDKFSDAEFSYQNCNIDYFVTSTKREYEFIKETYGYPDHAIGCVGLARFDNLYTPHVVEDKILVMPTWRKWLDDSQKKFINSDYYLAYAEFLKNKELIQYLRQNNYKLIFYMHYKMQPFVESFRAFENDVVTIADKNNYDVQNLLMTSKLMITDYSSVYFDFAYMNKPVVYYQFDEKQFRSNHYAEGYFSYKEDGFGPCFDNCDDLRRYIIKMIDEQCRQPEKYEMRVKEFFDLHDNHNCERTYNALKKLEEK